MTVEAKELTAADPGRVRGAALGVVMAALMLSLFLEALDQTVVGTAMPRIIATLHGFDRYAWTVSAYLLASTVVIPIAGTLSDQVGRRPFLVGGTAVFLTGSALCGTAQTINQLIVFRAVQGLGAGIGISLIFTAVADLFPPEERAKWQGVLGSVYGVSSVVGPTLGGWLTEHGPVMGDLVTDNARWRWVFFINLPLGAVALAALLMYLPADFSVRSSQSRGWALVRRIDSAGALTIAAATILLLIGLTWIGEGTDNWGSPRAISLLLAAAVLYVAFLLVEQRAAEPVLPLELFRVPVFTANALLTLFLWMALFGVALYVPLYIQGVLEASPTAAGATMTPFSISIVIGGWLAGAGITILQGCRAATVLGALIVAFGSGLLAHMTADTQFFEAAAYVAVAGLGMGILFTATSVAVQNALPMGQLGAGFGAVRYLGQTGGVLGAALVGTVVNSSLQSAVKRHLSSQMLRHLAADGVNLGAGPQTLFSPGYRLRVIHAALRRVAAGVPPGGHHDALAAAMSRQEVYFLDRGFQDLRLSLASAVHTGLLMTLLFSLAAVLAALCAIDPPTDSRRM